MYLDHFGLAEAPFRITPHTDFFFQGANRGATLEALLYAITHDEGIVKVSGEVGSGKTMLCRVLVERLPGNIETIYLANPTLSRDEILFAIADELRINLATNRVSAVLRALQEHLIDLYGSGRRVVILIDEAHAMPAETLEQIRLLSNLESSRHKLLQLVLFGQPELNEILTRPDMRQLKERITHNFSLEPLVRSDISEYISFRMRAAGYKGPDVFTPAALKLIASASHGLTRRVNILADKSLLAAFAENTHQITTSHVRAAICDAEYSISGSFSPRLQIRLWGFIAMILIVGAGLAYRLIANPGDQAAPLSVPNAAPASAEAREPQSSPPAARPMDEAAPTVPVALHAANATAAPTVSSVLKQHETPVQSAPLPSLKAPPAASDREAGLGLLTRQRLADTRLWLESASDNRWFIQLVSADGASASHVESFLANASRVADATAVRVYMVDVKGARRMGVIYGEFPSREAASQAIAQLPVSLKVHDPYPRQVRRLRN